MLKTEIDKQQTRFYTLLAREIIKSAMGEIKAQ
jgi:hypothetical protein